MNNARVTRVAHPQNLPLRSRPGFSIISIIIVIALIAIAVGLLLPKIIPKRKLPAAFDEVGVGRMEGNLCINDFFGVSIQAPEGWQVDSEETLRRWLRQKSKDDQKHMAIVFFALKPRKPATGVVEPMLLIAARRLSSMPEVKTMDDFMERTQRIRERKAYNTGDPGKPYKAVLGGQACIRLDAGQRYGTGVVNSVLFAMLRRGYALSIGGTWQTDEDRRALMDSLKTVWFK
jgi:hypothetical protein